MALRVVFFGTPAFAATVLEGLIESPHEVVAVACAPDRPSGRGRKVRRGAVSALAHERALPLVQPRSLRDAETQDALRAFDADVFAVASYGLIFPESALAMPRLGAFNAHGSLLPELRGAAPVERAILAGLTRTGISVQRMVREVDAGDVYASRETDIRPGENAGDLRERMARIAAELLPKVLSALDAGTACAEPQDASRVTFAPPLEPHERAIVWSEPAEMIDRRVRAFAPKPGAFALLPEELGRKRIKVLEATSVDAARSDRAPTEPGEVLAASAGDGLVVAAGEAALSLVTVQPESKRPMDAKAFLRGHAVAPGQRFGDGVTDKRR